MNNDLKNTLRRLKTGLKLSFFHERYVTYTQDSLNILRETIK